MRVSPKRAPRAKDVSGEQASADAPQCTPVSDILAVAARRNDAPAHNDGPTIEAKLWAAVGIDARWASMPGQTEGTWHERRELLRERKPQVVRAMDVAVRAAELARQAATLHPGTQDFEHATIEIERLFETAFGNGRKIARMERIAIMDAFDSAAELLRTAKIFRAVDASARGEKVDRRTQELLKRNPDEVARARSLGAAQEPDEHEEEAELLDFAGVVVHQAREKFPRLIKLDERLDLVVEVLRVWEQHGHGVKGDSRWDALNPLLKRVGLSVKNPATLGVERSRYPNPLARETLTSQR